MDEVGEWMIKQVLKPQQLINISLYFVTSHCLKHSNVDLNPIHWPSYEIIEQINFIKLIKSNFLLEWLHLPFFFLFAFVSNFIILFLIVVFFVFLLLRFTCRLYTQNLWLQNPQYSYVERWNLKQSYHGYKDDMFLNPPFNNSFSRWKCPWYLLEIKCNSRQHTGANVYKIKYRLQWSYFQITM